MKSKFRIFTSILFCFGSLLTVSLALIIAINFSNSVQIFSKLLGETLVRGVGGLELALRTHLDAAEEQANFIVAHILSKDRAISELEGFCQIDPLNILKDLYHFISFIIAVLIISF